MLWRMVADRDLSKYFCGENVWSKKWEKSRNDEVAHVLVLDDEVEMAVWEASFGGVNKIFAAKEVSNGNWCFAIPVFDGSDSTLIRNGVE